MLRSISRFSYCHRSLARMRFQIVILTCFSIFTPVQASDAIPNNGVGSAAQRQRFLTQICDAQPRTNGCSTCPAETGFARSGTWDLSAIIFGHFLSRSSSDALVFGFGCEPHSEGFGGSYLFTKERTGWRRMWYAHGEIANNCKKVDGADGRDRLICEGSNQSQGAVSHFLYLLEPGKDPHSHGVNTHGNIFLMVYDTLDNCQPIPKGDTYLGKILSVSFVSPRKGRLTITVTANLGQAKIPAKILDACQSSEHMSQRPVMAGVLRRYRFLFDGQAVTPEAQNPSTEPPRVAWHSAK